MIVVEEQTWVTLLGFAGFGLALLTFLTTMKRDIKADIGSLRGELKADIGSLRSELKADIGSLRSELKADIAGARSEAKADHRELKADIARIDGRLTTLENRTYDISLRLPPAPASAPGSP